MPLPQVRPLVREHGGELGLVEQVKGARADHDRRAQPGDAVGGRRRVIDDQRAGDLGVTVREQAEQHPLPLPGAQHRGRRRRPGSSRAARAARRPRSATASRQRRKDRRRASPGPSAVARPSAWPPWWRPDATLGQAGARAAPLELEAPKPASAPTVARPQPSPSACHSTIATAGRPARPARAPASGARPGRSRPRRRRAGRRRGHTAIRSCRLPLSASSAARSAVGLGAGHAAGEPGQRGLPVAGLVKRRQHQLGDVGFAGLGRPVTPGAASPLPADETLLGQPVEHGHHRRVCQVAVGELLADLPDRHRV